MENENDLQYITGDTNLIQEKKKCWIKKLGCYKLFAPNPMLQIINLANYDGNLHEKSSAMCTYASPL